MRHLSLHPVEAGQTLAQPRSKTTLRPCLRHSNTSSNRNRLCVLLNKPSSNKLWRDLNRQDSPDTRNNSSYISSNSRHNSSNRPTKPSHNSRSHHHRLRRLVPRLGLGRGLVSPSQTPRLSASSRSFATLAIPRKNSATWSRSAKVLPVVSTRLLKSGPTSVLLSSR